MTYYIKIALFTCVVLSPFLSLYSQDKNGEKNLRPELVVMFGAGFLQQERIMLSVKHMDENEKILIDERLYRPHWTQDVNSFKVSLEKGVMNCVIINLPDRKINKRFNFSLEKDLYLVLSIDLSNELFTAIYDHTVKFD